MNRLHFFADRFDPLLPLSIGSLIAGIVFIRLYFGDITLTYDSWVYWEGAINLLEGKGYRDLANTPITAWPPLYSLSLAIWGKMFGLHVGAVKLFSIIMAFFNGVIWAHLLIKCSAHQIRAVKLVSLAFLVLFLPETSQALLSEVIYFPLLGLFLIAFLKQAEMRHGALNTLTMAATLSLLLLTRNQALVLIPAVLIAAWVLFDRRSLSDAAIASSIAILAWVLCRTYLNQWAAFSLQPEPASFFTELNSLFVSTGAMFAVSKMQLDNFALALVCLFLIFSAIEIIRSVLSQNVDWAYPNGGFVFLLFALAVYFGTIFTGLALGMPINQPRWFMAFVLLFSLACFSVSFRFKQFPMRSALSLALSCLIIITYVYRAQYFLFFWPSQSPRLQHHFLPSTAWIEQQSKDVNTKLATLGSREEAISVLGKPYSANTARRWQKLPLYTD